MHPNIPTEFYVRAAETGMSLEEVQAAEKAASLDMLDSGALLAELRAHLPTAGAKVASARASLRAAMKLADGPMTEGGDPALAPAPAPEAPEAPQTGPSPYLDLLALLRALYDLYYAAHWKSRGPAGYADHLLFERLYGGLVGEFDGLAEKIVASGGSEAIDQAALAGKVAEILQGLAQHGSLFEQALAGEQALQAGIEQAVGSATQGMQNFLQGIADAHETNMYLIQQRLNGVPTDKTASAGSLRAALGLRKEAINPNFDMGALKSRLANRGKAPAMSGFGVGKGVADMSPGFSTAYETVNKTRAAGGNVLGALLGAKKASAEKEASFPQHAAHGLAGAAVGAATGPENRVHGAVSGAGYGLVGGALGSAIGPAPGAIGSLLGGALGGKAARISAEWAKNYQNFGREFSLPENEARYRALLDQNGPYARLDRDAQEEAEDRAMRDPHFAEMYARHMGGPSKTAAWDGQRLKDVATDALVRGGVGAAIATGGVLAHRGITGLANKMTAGRDKQRLLDTDPRLGTMGTPEQIDLAYNSLRTFAPHVTKDPLAGANSLRAILATKDPHDPAAPPRLSGASIAQDLGKIAPQPSPHERLLSDAFLSGAQGAMRRSDDEASFHANEAAKRGIEDYKDQLTRGRDGDRAKLESEAKRHEMNVDALFNELKAQGYSDDYINALLMHP